jgi:hypothetical protein
MHPFLVFFEFANFWFHSYTCKSSDTSITYGQNYLLILGTSDIPHSNAVYDQNENRNLTKKCLDNVSSIIICAQCYISGPL